MLELCRVTGNEKWRNATEELLAAGISCLRNTYDISQMEKVSLYKGQIALALLAQDLRSSRESAFPFFGD
jgi:hypothetical protein